MNEAEYLMKNYGDRGGCYGGGQIKKLQHVQNAAAPLITLSRKQEQITPTLLNLHWLPINHFIASCLKFYSSRLMYKALNNLAPSYICYLLIPCISSCQLRLSSKNLLSIPHFNLRTYDARSFSVAAPTLWNTLLSDIKNSPPVSVFKNRLKTFFFKTKNIFITFCYNLLAIIILVLRFKVFFAIFFISLSLFFIVLVKRFWT